MRGTAVTAALAIVLSSCAGGADEPEAPEPGPLEVLTDDVGCAGGGGADSLIVSNAALRNTADIPLTIDEVSLVGARNAELHAALAGNKPAVDSTLEAHGEPRAETTLTLQVHVPDPEATVHVETVSVAYHNVEGSFTADGALDLAITSRCRP